MTNTHTVSARHMSRFWSLALVMVLVLSTPIATASASSWSPTLLVNTEAFQTIDDGDGASDIELRFGDSVNESLFWDIQTSRFEFSDDVHTQGNLTASGTLTVEGAVATKANATINSDNGAADAVLTFGSDGTAETITFANTADQFELSDDVEIYGTASGRIVHAQDGLHSSGTLAVESIATIHGTLSGNTIEGFNLTDCDLESQTLGWDATNKRFECRSDDGGTSYGAGQGLTLNGSSFFSLNSTITGSSLEIFGTSSGRVLHAQDQLQSSGSLAVEGTTTLHGATTINSTLDTTGSITTDANLTINEDNGDADAVLTFGNDSGAKAITYSNTNTRFEFNDDIKTTGNLSGSTLTVDGALTLHGQTYNFPTNGGSSGYVLRTDGAGNLTWTSGVKDGSGGVLSLHPEYPNATYVASGSTMIGQLALSGAYNATFENTYVWTSTNASIQNYWISVRVRVPDNFARWDPSTPIQLRYRTESSTVTDNHVTLYMRDTANSLVSLTGGNGLANTAFTTANITGPQAAGTYTPGGYITFFIKLAANSAGQANVGFLNINWETRTP